MSINDKIIPVTPEQRAVLTATRGEAPARTNVAHPLPGQGANHAPRIAPAPPAPPAATGATLPNSSVPPADLAAAAAAALTTKGLSMPTPPKPPRKPKRFDL